MLTVLKELIKQENDGSAYPCCNFPNSTPAAIDLPPFYSTVTRLDPVCYPHADFSKTR